MQQLITQCQDCDAQIMELLQAQLKEMEGYKPGFSCWQRRRNRTGEFSAVPEVVRNTVFYFFEVLLRIGIQ